MGAFLSEPVTEKVSADEEHERLSYGVCSMQGWRFTQEDNHSCFPKLDDGTSLFGVYDGHGGAEVSRYVASLLPDYVRQRECWKNGEIGRALSEAFLALDAHLGSRKGLRVLKKLAAEDDAALDKDKNKSSADDDGESEDGSEENVRNLFKEARMPLQMLMAKYGQALAAADDESDTSEEDDGDEPSVSTSPKGNKSKDEEEKKDEEKNLEGSSAATTIKASKSEEMNKEDEKAAKVEEEKPKENGLPEEDKAVTKNGSSGRSKLRSRPNRIVYADNDDDDDTSDEEYDENSSSLMEEEPDDGEESSIDEDDEEDDLENSLAAGDEFAMNMLQGPGLDSGCTAVVAVLEAGGILYVANAGDSRCILSRKGVAIDMSVDHKPEDEEESKRIKEAGGEVTSEGRVNGGLNLSRALGDHAYKQGECGARKQMITALPDVRKIQLRKEEDEFMVLACDGIWNSMTSQDVVDFVRSRLYKTTSKEKVPALLKERTKLSDGVKLSEICGEMFDHCLAPNTSGDGTGCDNMTAILVTFKEKMWTNDDTKMMNKEESESSEKNVVEKMEKKSSSKETEEKMNTAAQVIETNPDPLEKGDNKVIAINAESSKESDPIAVKPEKEDPITEKDVKQEDKEEGDKEDDHGIILLTPPPTPIIPPEDEESSEEEEFEEGEGIEEDEDEGEEEDEGVMEEEEADEMEDKEKLLEGSLIKENSKSPISLGKACKRAATTTTKESPVKIKKQKVEEDEEAAS